MGDATGRRRLLAAGASAGFAGVAGCLSVFGGDSRAPVELSVLNETEENLRVQATVDGRIRLSLSVQTCEGD